MIFLPIVLVCFIALGVIFSVVFNDANYVGMGWLVGIIVIMVLGAPSLMKDPSNITIKDYELNSNVPYHAFKDTYTFFTVDETDKIINNTTIYKGNITTIFNSENKYKIQVTIKHYSKTPILSEVMPSLYGERDVIDKVILFLPTAK